MLGPDSLRTSSSAGAPTLPPGLGFLIHTQAALGEQRPFCSREVEEGGIWVIGSLFSWSHIPRSSVPIVHRGEVLRPLPAMSLSKGVPAPSWTPGFKGVRGQNLLAGPLTQPMSLPGIPTWPEGPVGWPGVSISVRCGRGTYKGLLRGADAAGSCGLCAEPLLATWAGRGGAAAGWTDTGLRPKGMTAWAVGLVDPARG